MAGSDADDLVKNSPLAVAEEKGTDMSDADLAAVVPAAEEEEEEEEEEELVGAEEPAPAAEGRRMWRVPPQQVDYILSLDFAADVSPNLDRFDRLPYTEEQKERYRAAALEGAAARNQLRRLMRETQQRFRDLLDKHGEVVIDEKHRLDRYLDRSKNNSSSSNYLRV